MTDEWLEFVFMMNVFFKDEEIKEDDLYFMCYMIERVARNLQARNRDVVNTIGSILIYAER